MSISTIIMILAIINFAVIPTFKDRVIPVKKLIITPAIFMYLFYQTLNDNFNIHLVNPWIIASGILAGVIIGIFLRKNTVIKSDKDKLLIWLPGNYLSLVTFTLIFSIHYAIGYLQATNPSYLTQINFGEEVLLFLISCVSSITIGANALLFMKYVMCESSELTVITVRGKINNIA